VQTHTGYPKHLLEFSGVNVGSKERLHPTQKPVDLLEYLIKTYTNPGETVLDNCMGSGSTRRCLCQHRAKVYRDRKRPEIF
jgi:site-specific DNA-methyltransferase (adenine-specific)